MLKHALLASVVIHSERLFMKTWFAITLCAMTLTNSSEVRAHDLQPPSWLRGGPYTTSAEWDFLEPTRLTFPDGNSVPTIAASDYPNMTQHASVHAWEEHLSWVPFDGSGGWRGPGWVTFNNPHWIEQESVAFVRIQMTYQLDLARPSSDLPLLYIGDLMSSVQVTGRSPALDIPFPGSTIPGLRYRLYELELRPNFGYELFGINVPTNAVLDQVVIDTLSVPEPSSLALTAMGVFFTGLLAWRRRRASDSRSFLFRPLRAGAHRLFCRRARFFASARAVAALCLLGMLVADARAITIDTVPIGYAGNAGNPSTTARLGAVHYDYRMGTYEVTVGQYCAFLNAVAVTDSNLLYNTKMGTDPLSAGIARGGVPGSYSYSEIGSPNKPITYVSWASAARFANWLHNGQPTGLQNSTTTEAGAYNFPRFGLPVSRSPAAKWFIPSRSEWHKSAYYQPASEGGDSDSYWKYPTQTNSEPNSDQPPGDASIQSNVANFGRDDFQANGFNDGYTVTGSRFYDPNVNYLTDVGSYPLSRNFFGTLDQAGNAYEWLEEAFIDLHYMSGGSWADPASRLDSADTGLYSDDGTYYLGFRVAGIPTVPEPSSFVLGAIGLMGLSAWGWRRAWPERQSQIAITESLQ